MAMKVRYTTVNGRIISQNKGGVYTRLLSDPLGNVIATVDASGVKTNDTTYWPYGEVRTGGVSTVTSLGFCGAWGYYTDASARLYVRARYYRPVLGRWQSVDPLWPEESAYGYARCNPVTFTDSTGESTYADLLCKGPGGNCCRSDGPTYPPSKRCCECASSAGFRDVYMFCRHIRAWYDIEPPTPGLNDLRCLRNNLSKAKAYAAMHCPPGNDKCLHCMTSCYLAQKCGKGPALWTGWCKELQDLTDCKKTGVFDPKDMDANKVGVDGSGKPCTQACQRFGAQ